ncbi:UNVERIFIED_CONTAM: hypothetical protein Sradi_3234300 [Sesamum radiatum]|uniref:Uncharacterized protein n=1 Tax=Sesamum radiatum TaxID=300843 RepID=A0AAW2RGV0_SESRA
MVPGPPRSVDPLTEPPHHSTSSGGLPPGLIYTIQHMVTTAIQEQITTLFPAHTVTPSYVDVPNKEDKRVPLAPIPLVIGGQGPASQTQEDVPLQWLVCLEPLQKGLQDVQYQIAGTPSDRQQGVFFNEEIMADELPLN